MTKNEEKITNQLLKFGLTKDEIDGLSLKKAISYIRFYHENKFNSRIFRNATLLSAFHPLESKYIEMARDYSGGNDSKLGTPKFKDSYDLLNNEFLYDFSVPIEFRIAKPLSNFDKDVLMKSFSFESKILYKVNLHKMTCSCPDFQKSERVQFSSGDLRRLCKHLMSEYKNRFGIYGQSKLNNFILDHGYSLRKNFRNFVIEKTNQKVILNYDNTHDWWNLFIENKKGEYERFGYSPAQKGFAYNDKPIGIVGPLRAVLDNFYQNLNGSSTVTSGRNKGGPKQTTSPQGCANFLIFVILIVLLLTILT